MPGFTKVKDLVDSQVVNGSERYYTFRKAISLTPQSGIWFDFTMSPGNPVPKYWFDATPLIGVQIKQSTDGGLFHGSNVSPQIKYLRELMVFCTSATPLPMPMMLCDYLLYYPTIDETVTTPQVMTNNFPLPRYADGGGVQMMAVSTAPRTGGQTFTVNYTNSLGVSGRVTPNVAENNLGVNGNIVNSYTTNTLGAASGLFIPLQTGDLGVQSVQSVTMNGADVGLFSIVLVKPLANLSIRGVDAPVEVDYFKDFSITPIIQDDAYLNLLGVPQGNLSGTQIHGSIRTTFF